MELQGHGWTEIRNGDACPPVFDITTAQYRMKDLNSNNAQRRGSTWVHSSSHHLRVKEIKLTIEYHPFKASLGASRKRRSNCYDLEGCLERASCTECTVCRPGCIEPQCSHYSCRRSQCTYQRNSLSVVRIQQCAAVMGG